MRVAHPQLARQCGFRHSGHSHDVAAVAFQAIDLGRRFEPWPLRGRIRTAVGGVDSGTPGRVEQAGAEAFAIGTGEVDVRPMPGAVLEERMPPAPRVVDDLVGNRDCAAVEIGTDAPDRGDSDDPPYPRVVQGPDVGAVVDPMGGDDVRRTVARKERDLDAFQPAVAERRRGPAPWRIDRLLAHQLQAVEHRQARSPDDRQIVHAGPSA